MALRNRGTYPRLVGSHDESTDTKVVSAKIKHTVRTLDDALKVCKVDLAVWEPERWICNKWDNVSAEYGAVELWQVKVWFRRKVSKLAETSADYLVNRLRSVSTKPVKYAKIKQLYDPHCLVVGLFDAHFGKLAWAEETGENQDLKIAEQIFRQAGDEIRIKAASFPVEKFILPVGNDFLHIDGPRNETANGTPQDFDGRYAKVVATGEIALENLIRSLAEVAPVEVVSVPGNHDKATTWHIARYLWARFADNNRVTVDTSPKLRKYVKYGVNLLGFTHGDCIKDDKLPLLMAQEQPKAWGETTFREMLTGHFHKRKETRFNVGDTHTGVVVRVLPSLSATDAWHYQMGFVKSQRAAEAYLYSKEHGYTGHFSANLRVAA